MKRSLLVLMIVLFVGALTGCDMLGPDGGEPSPAPDGGDQSVLVEE